MGNSNSKYVSIYKYIEVKLGGIVVCAGGNFEYTSKT